MSDKSIPEEAQIDAALTGRYWSLVDRYCDGAWADLPMKWTVTFDAIVNEAKRRGLEAFAVARARSEGFFLLKRETDYVVFYLERGVRSSEQSFEQLEPAFIYWLDQDLRFHLLPGRAVD
jgi:hypothetical protein